MLLLNAVIQLGREAKIQLHTKDTFHVWYHLGCGKQTGVVFQCPLELGSSNGKIQRLHPIDSHWHIDPIDPLNLPMNPAKDSPLTADSRITWAVLPKLTCQSSTAGATTAGQRHHWVSTYAPMNQCGLDMFWIQNMDKDMKNTSKAGT